MQLLRILLDKLVRWIRTTPLGSVPLTGVLGLALVVLGWYHLRSSNNSRSRQRQQRPSSQQQQAQQQSGAAPAGAAAASGAGASAQATQAAPQRSGKPAAPVQSAIPVHASIRSALSGVRRVTLSVPGVLLHEWQAPELSDSATMRDEVVAALQQVAAITDVYLIAHVADDVGEAAVTGALEACGVLAPSTAAPPPPGTIRPHRLLFCSTLEGKVSIVRQLEPDLHVDGHAVTVRDLQRFIPQLLHVRPPAEAAAAAGSSSAFSSPNVAVHDSLLAFLGL